MVVMVTLIMTSRANGGPGDGRPQLYPNPALDHAFIQWPDQLDGRDVHVWVYDATGREVEGMNATSQGGRIRVHTHHLSAGVYLVKVKVDNREETLRMLK